LLEAEVRTREEEEKKEKEDLGKLVGAAEQQGKHHLITGRL